MKYKKAPLARQAIKHLVKDRRYDYIETGSPHYRSQEQSGYPAAERGDAGRYVSDGL